MRVVTQHLITDCLSGYRRKAGFFTFLCGLSCGLTLAVAHDRRWGSAVFDLIVSGLAAFNAWNNWRKV
jgi:hypothetical protein